MKQDNSSFDRLAPTSATPTKIERLYNLIPAIYRIRDEAQGEQLRALLSIIESELTSIEDDIGDLYQNWFIETCADWVVPYIGDLLAVRDLNVASPRTYGQERRAYVANTLAYRQRKGTTPVLEQLARDITGWGARALEALPLLATTQNLNHNRFNGTVNLGINNRYDGLRIGKRPEQLGTPFENIAAYTAELPRLTGDRGRYNPASVNLYLWRLQSYPIEWGRARSIQPPPQNLPGYYFSFNPVGEAAPLFNQPQTETELIQLAQEINLPGILTRETIRNVLNQQKDSLEYLHYFGSHPVFQIKIDNAEDVLKPDFEIDNLQWEEENWQAPQSPQDCAEEAKVIVDPESGRFVLFTDKEPDCVQVSYAYGFSGDVGGGSYERPSTISETLSPNSEIIWDVTNTVSLDRAVKEWNQTAQKWQNCYDRTYIPLARIAIDENGEPTILQPIDRWHPQWHPQLKPGILSGLQVIGDPGDLEVTVMPGIAVNDRGEIIYLHISYHLILGDYCHQKVWLVISYLQREWNPRWQINVVTSETESEYPSNLYIRLARITLDPDGRVEEIEPVDLAENSFIPGIVKGLDVSVSINPSDRDIIVSVANDSKSPGIAVNSKAQALTLDRPISKSLAKLLDRNLKDKTLLNRRIILFLLPGEQPKLGAVLDAEIGIIRIRGNGTSVRDLALKIPATKQLHLIAVNGDRPHLLGNIFLRGISNPDILAAGEFWLDGLLLEGQLVVSSGNLQTLHISHSTLVPSAGGIVVEKPEYEIIDEDSTDVVLLAMLMYSITLFQRLLKIGLGKNKLSPQQRIARITTITFQQISNAVNAVQHFIQQWQQKESPQESAEIESNYNADCSEDREDKPSKFDSLCLEPSESDFDLDNGQLNIIIDRSICGSIALADTVPELKIVDSIIDADIENDCFGAIAAVGTAINMQNTTVFGTTIARSLEASNSIFRDKVMTLRQQVGCLRFCYVPVSSRTPPRYRCQPDLLLAETIKTPPAAITSLYWRSPVLRSHDFPIKFWILLVILNSLVGILFLDEYLQLFIGTAGNGVFYYNHSQQTWIPLQSGLDRVIITSLIVLSQKDRSASFLLAGTASGMLFKTSLPRLKAGTGVITSRGTQVKGTGTSFLTELTLGDTIVLEEQVRTVVKISSDLDLQIERPFERDLVKPNLHFSINRTQWTPVNKPLSNTIVTKIIQDEREEKNIIFATTAGSGVFRFLDGEKWTRVNYGLTNLDIRAIEIDLRDRRLFVGTYGGGVFWSNDDGDNWNGGDPVDPEIRQSGLTDPYITTLTINSDNGNIFVGTAGNGIFRSSDRGEHWQPINRGLKNPNITALIQDTRSDLGAIVTTNDLQITFSNPESISSLPEGKYTIIANEQTRILNIRKNSNQEPIILNDAFDPDLTEPTPFTLIDLYAGTNNGDIFHSTDEGQTWQAIGTGLTDTEITALTFASINGDRVLVATTRIGSVFYLKDRKNWLPLNTGLDRVDAALTLLNQIQPDFTSITYGNPSYAQLSNTCPVEIYTGAEDGSEMGAFSYLKQPQRAANLQASLTEYLRFGLQAKINYIT